MVEPRPTGSREHHNVIRLGGASNQTLRLGILGLAHNIVAVNNELRVVGNVRVGVLCERLEEPVLVDFQV